MQNAAEPRDRAADFDHDHEREAALDNDPLTAQFFSQPPPQAWEVALDDWQPRPLSREERRAMFATFALLGSGALAAFAFLLFPDAWLVTPAPLRGAQAALAPLGAPLDPAPPELVAPGLVAPELAAVAPAAAENPPPAASVVSMPVPSAPTVPSAAPASAEPASAEPAAAPVPSAPAPSAVLADSALPSAATAVPAAAPARARRSAARSGRAPADALVAQARRALTAGDARRARDLASRAIQLAPARAGAYIVLAGAHDALGERASMRAAFRSCVQNAQDALASACRSLAQ